MTASIMLLFFDINGASYEEQTQAPPTYPRGQIRRQDGEDTHVRKVPEEP
jgi:hypothetical protein